MRLGQRFPPVAAALSALAVFACCVPLGFAGAFGVFAVGAIFASLQPWFVGAAMLLLAVGAWQAFRAQKACHRRASRFSLVVLGLSAAIVVAVLLFPQRLAAWIADYLL
jgi:hypothetical protein